VSKKAFRGGVEQLSTESPEGRDLHSVRGAPSPDAGAKVARIRCKNLRPHESMAVAAAGVCKALPCLGNKLPIVGVRFERKF